MPHPASMLERATRTVTRWSSGRGGPRSEPAGWLPAPVAALRPRSHALRSSLQLQKGTFSRPGRDWAELLPCLGVRVFWLKVRSSSEAEFRDDFITGTWCCHAGDLLSDLISFKGKAAVGKSVLNVDVVLLLKTPK